MQNSVLGLLTRGLQITAAVEASNKQSPRLLLGDSVLLPHPMLRCNLWIHPSFGSLMQLHLYFHYYFFHMIVLKLASSGVPLENSINAHIQ